MNKAIAMPSKIHQRFSSIISKANDVTADRTSTEVAVGAFADNNVPKRILKGSMTFTAIILLAR